MKNIMDKLLPSKEIMILDQKNKRANLLLSMQFIQKYELVDNFAKYLIDRKTEKMILYKISNFYEPIAMYFEKPKKENLGLFGIEFDKDDLSIFLNSLGTDRERLRLLITGYILNDMLQKIDKQSEKVLGEPIDLTITKLLLKVDKKINDIDLASEKIWLAYFNRLNAIYLLIKKEHEYPNELCKNVKSFVLRHNDTASAVSDEAEDNIDDLANSVLEYIAKNDDDVKDVFGCIYKIFNTLDDAFSEEIDTLLNAKLWSLINSIERESSSTLYKLFTPRDPCNRKDIEAKEVAKLFIRARKTMLEKSVFEKYSDDLLLLSKFGNGEKEVIESTLLAYFKCKPDRMTTLQREIAQAVEKDDKRSIIKNMESAICKLLGEGKIGIESEEEGLLLMEAIEQFLETVRKRIILHKNENRPQMEKQFNNAKETLEIFLRRSGRFDIADRIHNEDYIKPDTIKEYALRWKEYWRHRINKLRGANTKRTQDILTGIEKRIRIIVEKEQTKKGVDQSTKKKLNICISQNVPYEEWYKKLIDLDEDI